MPLKKILYIFLTAVAFLSVSTLQAKSSISYRELALADTVTRRVLEVKDTLVTLDSSKFAIEDIYSTKSYGDVPAKKQAILDKWL